MLDNVTSPTRQCYDKTYYGLALDGNGNLWLTRRDPGNDGTPPGLSFVNTQTGLTTDVQDTSVETDGVGICFGGVYFAQGSTLYKVAVAPDPPFAVQTVSINGTVGGAYNGFVCDGSGNVWFSDITDGQLINSRPLRVHSPCTLASTGLSRLPSRARPSTWRRTVDRRTAARRP